ncbi:MAG: aminotransferase class V-fold PLP-dependent enzyme, partial [Rhodobacteraceae bacterium]|nr:aminotransferase class V-fold PLP-dependent enzyme [Paracoccaceae bacterium]
QASTPVDGRVQTVMREASEALFANPHSADHSLGWQAAAAIKRAAQQVGNLFGLQGDDVIFTSGASEANAMVFCGAQRVGEQSEQNGVLIGAADHASVLQEALRGDLTVRHIALNGRGAPDPASLETLLCTSTTLVSIVGVNNENGAIADLGTISEMCRDHRALLHVDLSQAPLATDIDLLDLDIDFATISSHKLYGPKGVGALLTGPGLNDFIEPVIVGAGQQGGRRGGTMPTELIVGFGEACRILSQEAKSERKSVANLRNRFVSIIEQNQIGTLVGKLDQRHPGNALMRFPGHDASDLLAKVQPLIAASTQSACSSGSIEPSHVLRAMGFDDTFASECIRFSFGRFSTNEHVDASTRILMRAISMA